VARVDRVLRSIEQDPTRARWVTYGHQPPGPPQLPLRTKKAKASSLVRRRDSLSGRRCITQKAVGNREAGRGQSKRTLEPRGLTARRRFTEPPLCGPRPTREKRNATAVKSEADLQQRNILRRRVAVARARALSRLAQATGLGQRDNLREEVTRRLIEPKMVAEPKVILMTMDRDLEAGFGETGKRLRIRLREGTHDATPPRN